MTDRNEQIAEFAEKNGLTEAEANLVYVENDPDRTILNFTFLQEVKTGKVHDADQTQETDLQKQAMDLLNQADEAMKAGDTTRSISLRRQAYNKKK